MYKQITSPAIVLSRTNFNEVDRIVTLLTPKGQVQCLVKGARRIKSKLAAGVELFSVGRVTYLDTQGNLKRIIQSDLMEHYGDIAKNLERMLFGYECMKQMRKTCPEETNDTAYFLTLKNLFINLNKLSTPLDLIKIWWAIQTLKLNGEQLELYKDFEQKTLIPNHNYSLTSETYRLQQDLNGRIGHDQIKILRLLSEAEDLSQLARLNKISSVYNLL